MNKRLVFVVLFIEFLQLPETDTDNVTRSYTKFQEKHMQNASKIIENLSKVSFI